MDVKREHFRAMILYDFKSGLTASQSLERLSTAFPNSTPSRTTVFDWYAEIRRGRASLEDSARSGRPQEVTTDDNVQVVRELIQVDARVTLEYLASHLNMSIGSIHTILYDKLKMRKVSARLLARLTQVQKDNRVAWCQQMLQRFHNGASRHIRNIVTGDETWVYCFDPETKQQSSQWTVSGQPPPTKCIRSRSVNKKMVATWVMSRGHVTTVHVEDRRTVTADWYTNVCLPQVMRVTQPLLARNSRLLLHQDNAPAHSAHLTTNFLNDQNVEVLGHPPYSPDLAPCDFFVFPYVKQQLRGIRFVSPDHAVNAFEAELDKITPELWTTCFQKWFVRMTKCIIHGGEYFEKL